MGNFDWLTILTYLGIGYAILYTGSKIIFSLMSLLEIRIYFWRYDHIIEEHELVSHLKKNKHDLPLISIISPAYNEGVIIIDAVSSFLNQSYQNKEVIICSDGGTDNTLSKLIDHFELVEVPNNFTHSGHLNHKNIKRYFKSSNPRYHELVVLDKENGGKADAQNAGVSLARGEIVTIVDADCILERYALIHLADIFEREGRVIGVGTPIGVVNDCEVGPDGVEDASVPKSFWAKIQVIEYLRSFLLGRMFAQRYRGLQIVSGAFGVYRKWILEAVGGYSTGSLAEDMDIDGKIWRYIDQNNLKYRIRYIPEAFCWSEVPNTLKTLASQRDRWARGMTQTIWKNKDLFFNPKYKLLGLFSYPYYVIFEWFTPFLEVVGLLYFFIGASLGWFSFMILEHIFLGYWAVGVLLNFGALSVEAFTRGHYKNRKTLLRLSLYAIIEPLFYHWINSYIYVVGNLKMLFLRKMEWGVMERTGIKKNHSINDLVLTEASVSWVYRYRSVLLSVIVLLSLISVSWFYLKQPSNDKKELAGVAMIPKEFPIIKAGETNQDKTDTLVSTMNPVLFNASSNQVIAGRIDTIHEQTGNYYIVFASIINPEFVRSNLKTLSDQGVNIKIIPSSVNQRFNRLILDELPTLEDAQSRIDSLHSTYGDQLWVLKW